MTRVLVTAASRHGGTLGIATFMAEAFRAAGLEADVLAPEEVHGLGEYDAVVIGSGVYAGHWLPAAVQLVEREAAGLQGRPVWLFSSGPLGDPAKPDPATVDVSRIQAQSGAREHRVFAGRIDKKLLGFAERALVAALRAPQGDFRPWPEISAWAGSIAENLPERVAAGGGRR